MAPPTWKQKLGCLLHERRMAEFVLRCPKLAEQFGVTWLDLRNRLERIRRDERSGGRECRWAFSSQWTAARIFPQLGMRLLRHCMPSGVPLTYDLPHSTSDHPEVSVILPVGGANRLPLFRVVLAALLAQRDAAFEIIVVEQSFEPMLANHLPSAVAYRHAKSPAPDCAFNKSWALNVGARAANGDLLVIHDADYLPPPGYLRTCRDVLRTVDAVRPGRFIFYLNAEATQEIIDSRVFDLATLPDRGVECVVQNNPTPIALRRGTYWAIGGHDESYIGWGEEDAEFLERLRTRQICEAGWAPMVHLWHPSAPQKASGIRNHALHAVIATDPPLRRIEALRAMKLGGATPQVRSVVAEC